MEGITTLNKAWILAGKTLFFETSNEEDKRNCEVSHNPRMDFPFVIWFNGKLIHSSKTFQSLENRFAELSEKWDLIPSDND